MKNAMPGIIILWSEQELFSNSSDHKYRILNLRSTMTLEYMLSQAVMTHMPVKVVIDAKFAKLAIKLLGEQNVMVMPENNGASEDTLGYRLASAIADYSNVSGWLLLTADTPFIRSETLIEMASALENHVLVYPQYGGQQGYPIGLNGELFSEIMRLTSENDLRRLFIRYPSFAVEVEDPGVLMSSNSDNTHEINGAPMPWACAEQQPGDRPLLM
jgi:CTP:molybdopterin cytidylyltransferase MocA